MFHTGDVIRKLRNQRGWSQTELGERAGLNKDTVKRIEAGENPRQQSLERLAVALGSSLAAIYASAAGQAPATPEANADPIEDNVQDYERESIPVIQEGEASPHGLDWDGEGTPVSQLPKMSRPYDFRETGAYAIVLRGDSMEPLLKRGMRLIMSVVQPIGDGDLAYAQLVTGERLVKIATRQNGGWLLTSANPSYPPRFVHHDQIRSIHKVAYARMLK